MGIKSVAVERCSDLAEPLCAQLAPVRELVVSIPAPRCDHREHEDPTIAKQVLIGCRVVLTDFLGRMGDVELDRSAAACLEVYKEQPSLRPEQVARMRLAVQQLLAGTTPFDGAPQVSQSLAEKLPLCVRKLRSVGAAANQPLPDFYEMFIGCGPWSFVSVDFFGSAIGALPDGTPAQMQTTQAGLLATAGKANSNSRVALDAFPAEHIIIRTTAAQ